MNAIPGMDAAFADAATSLRSQIQGIVNHECLICITEFSMMGINASWAFDVEQCFTVNVESSGDSVSASVNIDVPNEFRLISNIKDAGINGQDTNLDSGNHDAEWLDDNSTNVAVSIQMIYENIRARVNGGTAQIVDALKGSIEECARDYVSNDLLKGMI